MFTILTSRFLDSENDDRASDVRLRAAELQPLGFEQYAATRETAFDVHVGGLGSAIRDRHLQRVNTGGQQILARRVTGDFDRLPRRNHFHVAFEERIHRETLVLADREAERAPRR